MSSINLHPTRHAHSLSMKQNLSTVPELRHSHLSGFAPQEETVHGLSWCSRSFIEQSWMSPHCGLILRIIVLFLTHQGKEGILWELWIGNCFALKPIVLMYFCAKG
jgi:hypothetical protein